MKADVLRRLITSYEAGQPVDLSAVLKYELLPAWEECYSNYAYVIYVKKNVCYL